jgi:hypothetical protein
MDHDRQSSILTPQPEHHNTDRTHKSTGKIDSDDACHLLIVRPTSCALLPVFIEHYVCMSIYSNSKIMAIIVNPCLHLITDHSFVCLYIVSAFPTLPDHEDIRQNYSVGPRGYGLCQQCPIEKSSPSPRYQSA